MQRAIAAFMLLVGTMVPAGIAVGDEAQNEKLAREHVEQVWNKGNLAEIDRMVGLNFVRYGPTNSTTVYGIDAFKKYVTEVRTAYPDLHATPIDTYTKGNRVSSRWTFQGTNSGPGDISPTGKRIKADVTSITRFEGGKIADIRVSWDFLGVYHQLGVEPPMDLPQENMATVREAIEELYQKGNVRVIDDLFAANYVGYSAADPEGMRGIQQIKDHVISVRKSFPDFYLSIDDMTAEGNTVVARWTARGTHKGEYRGIAPSNMKISVPGITVYRFEDGKIAESWAQWDLGGLTEQLRTAGK